jgi:TolB protein
MIVFTSDRGFDGARIWLGAPDGGSVRRLTKAYASEATWSRDGRRLAFVAFGTRGKRDLFVMNADGSGLRRITRTAAEEHQPSWSPDGKRIAFVREGKRRTDIYVIKSHRAGKRRLTASLRCKRSPAWSPNGRQIAFAGCEGYPSRLYLIRPDGTRVRPLPFRGDDPDWLPEGRRLAYRWGGELRVAALDGSGERTLAANLSASGGPAWSPDGRTLVFVRRAVSCTYEEDTLFLVEADGTSERQLFRHPPPPCADDYDPDW